MNSDSANLIVEHLPGYHPRPGREVKLNHVHTVTTGDVGGTEIISKLLETQGGWVYVSVAENTLSYYVPEKVARESVKLTDF